MCSPPPGRRAARRPYQGCILGSPASPEGGPSGVHFWLHFGLHSGPRFGPAGAPVWGPFRGHFWPRSGTRSGTIPGTLLVTFLAPLRSRFWLRFGATFGPLSDPGNPIWIQQDRFFHFCQVSHPPLRVRGKTLGGAPLCAGGDPRGRGAGHGFGADAKSMPWSGGASPSSHSNNQKVQ